MVRGRQAVGIVALVLGAIVCWTWWTAPSPEEREIRRRLDEFTATFNATSEEGLASLAQAVRIGQFFTEDVVVELGGGSPPIHGRDTVMGMAARLQPRTADFLLELVDVTVVDLDTERAELSLTAVLHGRSPSPAGESLDAREFSAEIRKRAGQWQISRLVAIDTLR